MSNDNSPKPHEPHEPEHVIVNVSGPFLGPNCELVPAMAAEIENFLVSRQAEKNELRLQLERWIATHSEFTPWTLARLTDDELAVLYMLVAD